QRAVLAALGLHQHFTALRAPDRDPAPLVVRIGLHTTLSIVGPLGEASELAATVVGETSRVLEALQRQAVPGTVVCSDATAPWVKGLVRLQAVRLGSGGAPHTLPKVYTVLGIRAQRVPGAWRTRQRIGRRTLPRRYTAGCTRSAWCLTTQPLCSSPSWGSRRTQRRWQHCCQRSARPVPLPPWCSCACTGVSSARSFWRSRICTGA